jgi:hypothetical protein
VWRQKPAATDPLLTNHSRGVRGEGGVRNCDSCSSCTLLLVINIILDSLKKHVPHFFIVVQSQDRV